MKFEHLSVIPLIKFFSKEPKFTQWLCENTSFLEQALSIELDPYVQTEERQKGGFVIDLVANIKKNKNLKVIIENQFGISDHKHLGQLLAYSIESNAKIAVWVTETLRDEHRETLDKLNHSFDKERFFFGIEVHALQIGSKKEVSKPAIEFNVVVKPDKWEDWLFTYKLSTPQGIYFSFWRQIFDHFALNFHRWQPKSPNKDNWITAYVNHGVYFRWSFKRNDPNKEFCVETAIEFSETSKNDYIFGELEKMKQTIEEDMKCTLTWDQQSHAKRCLIYTSFPRLFQLNEIPRDPLRKELIEWGVTTMKVMIHSFEDRLYNIQQGL